jgi:hypothetical protein
MQSQPHVLAACGRRAFANRSPRRVWITTAAWALLILCGPNSAAAAPYVRTGHIDQQCESSGQLCQPPASLIAGLIATSDVEVTVTASPGHCSDVRFYVLVDGKPGPVTGFLAPGQSATFRVPIPVSRYPNPHDLSIQAEGRVGGCNSGNLVAWQADASVAWDGQPLTERQKKAFGDCATAVGYSGVAIGAIGIAALLVPGFQSVGIGLAIVGFGLSGVGVVCDHEAHDPPRSDFKVVTKPRSVRLPRLRPTHRFTRPAATAINAVDKNDARLAELRSPFTLSVERYEGAAAARATQYVTLQQHLISGYGAEISARLRADVSLRRAATDALSASPMRSLVIRGRRLARARHALAHGHLRHRTARLLRQLAGRHAVRALLIRARRRARRPIRLAGVLASARLDQAELAAADEIDRVVIDLTSPAPPLQ